MKKRCRVFEEVKAEYILKRSKLMEYFFTAAVDFFKHNPLEPINTEEFEKECGVGVEITPDQVEAAVEDVINKYRDQLQEKRYKFNMGLLMGWSMNQLSQTQILDSSKLKEFADDNFILD